MPVPVQIQQNRIQIRLCSGLFGKLPYPFIDLSKCYKEYHSDLSPPLRLSKTHCRRLKRLTFRLVPVFRRIQSTQLHSAFSFTCSGSLILIYTLSGICPGIHAGIPDTGVVPSQRDTCGYVKERASYGSLFCRMAEVYGSKYSKGSRKYQKKCRMSRKNAG